MGIERRILRSGTVSLALSLTAAALLAACEPRTPNPNEPEPTERNPAPEAPPTAMQRSGTPSATLAPPAAGTPAAPIVPPSTNRAAGQSLPVAGTHVAAQANLQPVGDGGARGVVEFTSHAPGMMTIHVKLTGLETGEHGLHVHEYGDCSSLDGSAAGEHLAPEKDQHGSPDSGHEAHHSGDLGNIAANADGGDAEATITDDELTLDGAHGVVGRAVVVHANKDDYETQPSGASGDPVACGVVEAVAHLAPQAN